MKIQEINGKTDSELEYDLANLQKELFSMRIRGASETQTNPSRIREARRAIARIKTVLSERETGIHGRKSS